MMRLRYLAVAMIVIEAYLIAVIAKTYFFPIGAASLAVAALFIHGFIPPFRYRTTFTYFGLAIVYMVSILVNPGPSASAFGVLKSLGYPITQYLISVQIVRVYFRDGRGLTAIYPLLGILACSFAGNAFVMEAQRDLYHVGALAYIVVASLFYLSLCRPVEHSGSRRARNWALAAILILVLSLGSVNSTLLKRNQQELDLLFDSFFNTGTAISGPGFSQRARLGSIISRKRTEGKKTALRIYAESAPGYLRGKAYDTYHEGEWEFSGTSRPLGAVPVFLGEEGDYEDRFIIRESSSRPTKVLTIWRDSSLSRTLFAPLNTLQLSGSMETVNVNEHHIAEVVTSKSRRPYRAYAGATVSLEPLSVAQLRLYTLLPDDVDPRVRSLAESLFQDRETTLDKVAAVTSYFHGNYEYAIGIDIPLGIDPLTHFLVERPPAHCEYFTTGAAILLRLGGVPCRYVTGFVSFELNTVGDYWMARNEDAHAWVEAYDESQGWFIVEATPAEGVPTTREADAYAYWWDSMKQHMKELRLALLTGAARELFKKIFTLIASTAKTMVSTLPGISFLTLLVATVLWRIAGRLRRRLKRSPDEFEGLHDLLERMDKRIKRVGAARDPNETILHFASRLRDEFPENPIVSAAVRWYRDYAALRFDPAADEGLAQNLQRRLEEKV